jgi:hypothetical protein
MDEEAGCLPIPAGTKTAALLVATGEVDLARILDRQNTPTCALRGSSGSQRLHYPIDRDVVRRQKPVNGLLACARLAQLAQNQRARRRHTFDQPISPFRNPNIAE